jgi:tryptophan synthase beta chain
LDEFSTTWQVQQIARWNIPGVEVTEVTERRTRGEGADKPVAECLARAMPRTSDHKILLAESDLPTRWYNVLHDLPTPPPPVLHPGTGEPVGPEDLAPLFPMDLILQEVSQEQYVDIPGEVLDVYRLWRPSPLYRAHRLEKALDTPAHIYYKYEGVSPAGSHKPNTAVPQAYYNAKSGGRKLTTETGAGQWGTALAFACAQFGLDCEVWQVRASYDQKPYRRIMIEVFGGKVYPSPSDRTEAGRAILAADPDSPGSLGIAISEAVEVAAKAEDTKYALGSVLNHVLLHQTIIGEEALIQLAKVDETPDLIVGCTGGGSNFAGLFFPFLREKLAGRISPVIRAVEPSACPSLTRGVYAYDFGDTAGMTPLIKMHTLGHGFIPDPIHAGGLRYHGMSPVISHLYDQGLIEAVAKPQRECFAAGVQFARTEGILPAPEPTHALAAAIEEALRCRESGEERVILTALCGHGHLDLPAYEAYLSGTMIDRDLDAAALATAVEALPPVPVG